MNMNWEIYLHAEVEKFIKNLSKFEQAKCFWLFDILENTGVKLHEPFAKHIKDKIWELRPNEQIRILYFLQDTTFILIHAFKKKTRKVSLDDIKLAKLRMNNYLKRGDVK